jgi:GTP pyrophosphokinase
MTAKWIDSQEEFKAIINGNGCLGLTNQLTKVISNNMHVNIQSISLSTDAEFSWSSGSNCAKQHHFEKMINNIKKLTV